jgi:hypothetical protein
MALRPFQVSASSAESALMIPDASHLRGKYVDLEMPVVVIAGGKTDRSRDYAILGRIDPPQTFSGATHPSKRTFRGTVRFL